MLAVIISATTGRMRRVMANPDYRTAEQWGKLGVGKGEAVVYIAPKKGGWLPEELQAEVTKQTGLEPKDDDYAVVNDGAVVARVGCADPACGDLDQHVKDYPGAQFIAHAAADVGWAYDDAQKAFIAPAPTADELANVARKAQLANAGL